MLGKVFKAYDIRGVYPDPLSDKMAWQIGVGCAKFLLAEAERAGETTPMSRHIVVGRDMRKSSPGLSQKLIKGMTDAGAHVIDVGLVDTPFIYFAVNHLDCAGGVQTTASHNPPQYNGFKVSRRKAKPVGEATGLAEVRRFAATAEPSGGANSPDKGHVEQRDLWDAYIAHVRSFLDLKGKSLKVVIDASNGMAGTMVPRVFGKKGEAVPGLDIVEMNFDNSKGEFVHEPNPLLPSAIAALQEKVVEAGADLGVCFDGDADRCVVIDEKGQAVGCDLLTAWLAKSFLRDNPGSAIVYDLRSTRALAEDVAAAGGRPVRGRVGHVFLKALLAENSAVFGGELSGHYYFRDNFNADSGAIAMAVVLSALAASGKSMSANIKPIARYHQSGEINFHVEDKDAALEALKEAHGAGARVDELDGVTIDRWDKDGWWCNVRKSNTEPLLRLNLEARDKAVADRMIERIAPLLGERSDH